jgi:hypothetical protein
LFLSNSDNSLPFLVDKLQNEEENANAIEDKIFHLSKAPSVVKVLEEFDVSQYPNGLIFILSVKKDESVALFEEFISK